MYQFLDKTDNFEFLGPNLPKNGFWGQNFKNLSLDSESASLRYYVHQFSDKTDNFEFLGPNLPKNGFWGRNFKNLSLDLKSAPPIYHVCHFSVKMDNFSFFGLNLGKLPNHVQYFGSNIIAESCVEAEISWVEVEMGWVEVDLGAWFSNTSIKHIFLTLHSCLRVLFIFKLSH